MSEDRKSNAQESRVNATASAEISADALVAAAKALREGSVRSSRGENRGLPVLIAGGTAQDRRKAADAAARASGKVLQIVELNALVSKYIGETEKNIDAVFSDAARSGWVLYFDEADALLGKRTGVKDAHDRYANLEVSYLLKKIEAHPGIAILAANLMPSIDPALRKRLRYIVALP
jgi:AAA+ superfamily predicted ATPase